MYFILIKILSLVLFNQPPAAKLGFSVYAQVEKSWKSSCKARKNLRVLHYIFGEFLASLASPYYQESCMNIFMCKMLQDIVKSLAGYALQLFAPRSIDDGTSVAS